MNVWFVTFLVIDCAWLILNRRQSKLQAEDVANKAGLHEVIEKLGTDLRRARKKKVGKVDDDPVRFPSH